MIKITQLNNCPDFVLECASNLIRIFTPCFKLRVMHHEIEENLDQLID